MGFVESEFKGNELNIVKVIRITDSGVDVKDYINLTNYWGAIRKDTFYRPYQICQIAPEEFEKFVWNNNKLPLIHYDSLSEMMEKHKDLNPKENLDRYAFVIFKNNNLYISKGISNMREGVVLSLTDALDYFAGIPVFEFGSHFVNISEV